MIDNSTDPAAIDIKEDSVYVRISGHQRGVSTIPHPLETRGSRTWEGHVNDAPDDTRRLEVCSVYRGRWNVMFVETKDEELIDALEQEGHEALSPAEFDELLGTAPDPVYLRAPNERIARSALKIKGISPVDIEEEEVRAVNAEETEEEA